MGLMGEVLNRMTADSSWTEWLEADDVLVTSRSEIDAIAMRAYAHGWQDSLRHRTGSGPVSRPGRRFAEDRLVPLAAVLPFVRRGHARRP
jgi:hypothetical protein